MPDRPFPRLDWGLYLGIAAAWLVVGLLITTGPWFSDYHGRAFINIGYILLPLAGVVAAARHAVLTGGLIRRGWVLFGAAFASWGLGGIYWTYYELVLRRTPSFPNPSDVCLLGFAVLGAAAMVRLGREWGPRLRSVDLLDILFIAAATAYPIYDYALSEALEAHSESLLVVLASIAYPAADTAVLTIAIFTASRAHAARRGQPLLIAGGYALFAVTDSTWIYLTGLGLYVSGGPFDLLWHVAFIVIIFGLVLRQPESATLGPSQNPAVRAGTPLVLASIVAVLAVQDFLRQEIDAVETILLGILVSLLIIRQTIALYHNEQLRQGLAEANERLENAARFKTQFVNATAHELSNPLTPLRIHAALLGNEVYAASVENREKSSRVLVKNIERLMRLVQDLLDLGRIESGRLDIRVARLDMVLLAREAIQLFQASAAEKTVKIELAAPDSLFVAADAQRALQVMGNLLSNAIKYSPSGGRIRVELQDHPQQALVRIKDEGPGLDVGQRARLFKPFSQVHGERSQKPGTGLGLYICATLIERMRGRIGVDSPGAGAGSTFWFSLPKQPTERR